MEPAGSKRSRFHLGRTWWITILTIVVEALLATFTAAGVVEPNDVAIPAAAAAAAAASHNLGRAWEDGKRNANPHPVKE